MQIENRRLCTQTLSFNTPKQHMAAVNAGESLIKLHRSNCFNEVKYLFHIQLSHTYIIAGVQECKRFITHFSFSNSYTTYISEVFENVESVCIT